ncbi:DnaJ homolog subfamily B member 14 [Linum perenne]
MPNLFALNSIFFTSVYTLFVTFQFSVFSHCSLVITHHKMDTEEEHQQPTPLEQEATRLMSMAEAEFSTSNLNSALKHAKKAHRLCPHLDGLSSMLTSLKILRFATSDFTDWYSILQVDPLSHITTIKKQYKKLALLLHPDKNAFPGCEDVFKLLGQGFRVLSDKIRRKEYDLTFKARLLKTSSNREEDSVSSVVETFWTACSRCRLLHQFDRQFLGHNLICPTCNKSFQALEVEDNGEDKEVNGDENIGVRTDEVDQRSEDNDCTNETEWADGRLKIRDLRKRRSNGDEVLERSKSKTVRLDDEEEMMTLAELQVRAKRKASQGKSSLNGKNNRKGEKEKEKQNQEDMSNQTVRTSKKNKTQEAVKKSVLQKCISETSVKNVNLEIDGPELMEVEDSDFYDFDSDRSEKSFKKGQVWAIYDDIDGMPRHYGLIDEVVSVNPFEVKLSWLDLVDNGDERLISWGKLGLQVSCGSFKVARKMSIDSLNIFSHLLTCERAAREIYRIYPNKGSVWGVYSEKTSGSGGQHHPIREEPSYDFVVILSNYSEMFGLSMAYLDKVDGFKTVFKRREIGFHAVKYVKKDGLELFSHQIPARKLSTEEIPDLPKHCWELDPASLPPVLLRIGSG